MVPDADGLSWELDWPVLNVSWHAAMAHADWEASRTGQPWRLPFEMEWEKGARGADGRFFPWGDRFDPSFASMRLSHAGRPMLAVTESFPEDESVYGIRGMAGNVRDWTASVWREAGPLVENNRLAEALDRSDGTSNRVLRGGGWHDDAVNGRAAARGWNHPSNSESYLGARLLRSLEP